MTKDYIKLKYAGDDILYIPTNSLDEIRKYVGGEDLALKLNKLGTKDWEKTTAKVKNNLRTVAKELIELYARREKAKGFAFSKDNEWQKQFEGAFPYVETDDQLRCIEEVKKDMENDKPMDRLLCGDVGYGKTEVAIRAAFKAVMDHKQVAYLAPTTVLAKQQYETFKTRIEEYGVRVELLNRFRSSKDIKRIIRELKLGEVDIVIGTHRLLGKDVEFKDLGLLIIDEEHRFGVKAKEKIKEYKKDLNSYLVRKAKIAGEKSPSGSYLKALIRQRSEYENQLNSGTEYLTSTRSGVVSYRVDGLEDILTPANFGSLSKNMLENLHLKTGQIISTSEDSGKFIDNFCCYIACVLKDDILQEKGTNVGDSINMRLSNRKEVKATIEYISKENNEEDLVVFKLENYTEELINYRKISFDIIWWDVSGWKVPNNAIKYEKEDLAYVVCKRAGYTDKVYVQILKQGDKYSIIKNYDSGDELLEKGVSNDVVKNRKKVALYDEIQL